MGLPSDRAASDRTFSAIVLTSAALTGVVGLWVLGRWQLGLPPLVEAYRQLPPIQPLAALSLSLWSIALFAAAQRMRTLANLASLVLIALAAFRLYEAFSGRDFELDKLLFPNAFPGGTDHLRVRSGMAEATALNFLCLGGAVLGRPHFPRAATGLLIVPAYLSCLSLMALMFGVNSSAGVMGYTNMAAATTVGTLVAVAGALCLAPQPQWITHLRGATGNARITRLMLPLMVVIPVGLAWIALLGSRSGVYSDGYRLALTTMTTILLLGVTILWSHRLMEAQNAKLRETETIVRGVFENSTDLQFLHDARHPEFPLLMLNPAAQALIGPGSAVGQTPYEFAPHAADIVLSRLRHCAANGRVLRIVDENSSSRGLIWEMIYIPLIGADGTVERVLANMRDITGPKRAEQAAIAARADAEAATAAKAEFIANMSHELRTPLTSVIGFSELLKAQPELTDISRRFTVRIGNAGKALLSAVNDILDYSKLEAGEVEFDRTAESPAAVAAEALDLFSLQAADRSLSLELSGTETLPARAMIDAPRLRQVLLNLIGNAVKFTEQGEVRLHCSYDTERQLLIFAVSDTGPGIDTDQAAKLFRRYSQVVGAATRAGGTGLGLAICKGLVEAMGGEIGLSSVPGEGSVFRFTVPAKALERFDEIADAEVQSARVAGLRVLVVDDHVANREVVVGFLQPLGVEITEASSGQEAIEICELTPFDVILMDLRMPQMSGPEAARTIRAARGPNDRTPILSFSSSLPDPADAPLFEGAVQKPVTTGQLIDAISVAVDGEQPATQPGAQDVA